MDDSQDVLDFTGAKDDQLGNEHAVRLKSGICMASLTPGQAIMLEPHLEEEYMDRSEVKETCYSQTYGDYYNSTNARDADFDFLDDWENLKKRMIALTPDLGVYKWNRFKGRDTRAIPEKASVTLSYEMMVEGQDEPFDSSFIRGVPERFKLDSNQIIPGLEIVIKTMNVGDTAIAIIGPDYAFGKQGVPPRIPENAEILATIKLVKFTCEGEGERLLGLPSVDRSSRDFSEILTAATKDHEAGNQFYKDEEYKVAIQHYDFALKLINERSIGEKSSTEVKARLTKLYLNKAICYVNLNMAKQAVAHCNKALGLDPDNAKAHYRLGKAYALLDQYDEAKTHLMKAATLVPNSPDVDKQLHKIHKHIKEQATQELNYCQNMFKGYEETPKEIDSEVVDSEYYRLLHQFKHESDQDELRLPITFLQKNMDLMRKAAKYLDLDLTVVNFVGGKGQVIVIRKKCQ